MKECVFCGMPGGSREHIIAQWLIGRMALDKYPIIVAHRVEDNLMRRPEHGLLSYITTKVCKECNEGWMSHLEAAFQKYAGFLVEPHWPRLANEFILRAIVENELITKWALKTAITMSTNSMMKNVFDTETAREL